MKKILYLCGSLNQTTQMHQVARELPEVEAAFTPVLLRPASGGGPAARGSSSSPSWGPSCAGAASTISRRGGSPSISKAARAGTTSSSPAPTSSFRGTSGAAPGRGPGRDPRPRRLDVPLWRRFPLLPPLVAGTAATGCRSLRPLLRGQRGLPGPVRGARRARRPARRHRHSQLRRLPALPRQRLPASRVRPRVLLRRARDLQARRPGRFLQRCRRSPPAGPSS